MKTKKEINIPKFSDWLDKNKPEIATASYHISNGGTGRMTKCEQQCEDEAYQEYCDEFTDEFNKIDDEDLWAY